MNATQTNIAAKKIAAFETALALDNLEDAKTIWNSLNEHRRLDALAAVPLAMARYFQQWLKDNA